MKIKEKLKPFLFVGLLIVFAITMLIPANSYAGSIEYPGLRGWGEYGPSCMCPWPWDYECGCIIMEPQ